MSDPSPTGETVPDRAILRIAGPDREHFLQGLVSNDMRNISGPVYAALLSPQGKYLADFIIAPEPGRADALLLDVAAELAPDLVKKLKMYKLRADVTVETTDKYAIRGIGEIPADGYADPRHPGLGWRAWRDAPGAAPGTGPDWDALRVSLGVPESGRELTPESYILEMGFERLNGVNFRKGCYVGQEVTARMKHKTELKKGLVTVEVEGAAVEGTPLLTADGKEAGMLHTVAGGKGLAYLRFDRARGEMTAGPARVRWPEGTAGAAGDSAG